jgi:hypothetical protein
MRESQNGHKRLYIVEVKSTAVYVCRSSSKRQAIEDACLERGIIMLTLVYESAEAGEVPENEISHDSQS